MFDAFEHYPDLPPKPGEGDAPGVWREVELIAARARVLGETWSQIAARDDVPFKASTIACYVKRVWWPVAFNYFLQHERAVHEASERAALEREWRARDRRLKAVAAELALGTLIDIMRGLPVRDEVVYRRALLDGLDEVTADEAARAGGALPRPSDQVWAAKEALKATGYTKMNEALAVHAVELEREEFEASTKQGSGSGGLKVVARIDSGEGDT